MSLNIDLITRNDLCISCGTCKHACPYEAIRIEMNAAKGIYEPHILDAAACQTCPDQPCLQVCPSYEENFISLAGWDDPAQPIGPWHTISTGHSTATDVRTRASSGGIIKEICRFHLEQNLVDAVITLRHTEGLEYEPDMYTTVEDVMHTSGSIYHNINFERAVELLKTSPGRFLLIATPCQLTSIHKWMHLYPDQVKSELVRTIGLICGWQFTRHSLQHFSRAVNVDFAQLQDVSYRGGDAHGALVLKTPTKNHAFNRRVRFPRDRGAAIYRTAFSRVYNSRRCLLCVEHVNFLADIVVGDAWLKAFSDDNIGTSIIIVRNPTAQFVLDDLVKAGRLALAPAAEADVIESQSADLALGISAQQITNKLKSQGKFAPTYTLSNPERGVPGFDLWRKNEIEPRLFRFFTWHGYGYAWYRYRVIMYVVMFFVRLPGLVARKLTRIIRRRLGF